MSGLVVKKTIVAASLMLALVAGMEAGVLLLSEGAAFLDKSGTTAPYSRCGLPQHFLTQAVAENRSFQAEREGL
jgi:hypothetical protein